MLRHSGQGVEAPPSFGASADAESIHAPLCVFPAQASPRLLASVAVALFSGIAMCACVRGHRSVLLPRGRRSSM
eukprot:2685848-Alexandrium_andersonii.AAC.1